MNIYLKIKIVTTWKIKLEKVIFKKLKENVFFYLNSITIYKDKEIYNFLSRFYFF